jgi:hypothetical protein
VLGRCLPVYVAPSLARFPPTSCCRRRRRRRYLAFPLSSSGYSSSSLKVRPSPSSLTFARPSKTLSRSRGVPRRPKSGGDRMAFCPDCVLLSNKCVHLLRSEQLHHNETLQLNQIKLLSSSWRPSRPRKKTNAKNDWQQQHAAGVMAFRSSMPLAAAAAATATAGSAFRPNLPMVTSALRAASYVFARDCFLITTGLTAKPTSVKEPTFFGLTQATTHVPPCLNEE